MHQHDAQTNKQTNKQKKNKTKNNCTQLQDFCESFWDKNEKKKIYLHRYLYR
jgi:hypothetical protein